MARKLGPFVIILFSTFIIKLNRKQVAGETIIDVEKLLKDKFSPALYNKQIRGQNDLSKTMNITVTFLLQQLLKLDDLQETIEILGVLRTEWIDERLIWDPDTYNGTKKVYVAADKVWKPEIVVANPSSTVRFLGDDIQRLVTQHYYTGLAALIVGDVFQCSCYVDLTAFPWDEQNCTINFVVWAYQQNEIQLVTKQGNVKLERFESNGQWVLLSTRTYPSNDQMKSFLAFEIVMKRRATFFIVNILLPIFTLSVLNLIVFIVPIESGERMSFSITLLLSIGVFITLISENLPASAETMATICYLLLFVLVQSTIICLLNILSLRMYFKADGESEPSKYLEKCVVFCNRICCSLSKNQVHKTEKAEDKLDAENEEDIKKLDFDESEDTPISWKNISKFFDKVCLLMMTLFLIFSYTTFTYYVSIQK